MEAYVINYPGMAVDALHILGFACDAIQLTRRRTIIYVILPALTEIMYLKPHISIAVR